ncbi:MAG: Fur family transcriptional regulator [Arcobacteraceae bacterium]|jgi:Fur family ferric uptake transcriptional regulator
MNIETLITEKNIKPTAARIHMMKIFNNATKPLSYEDLRADLPMDKATFYRNILKFESEGILNSFESNDKKRYFELKLQPHAHFVCIKCNEIECVKKVDVLLEGYEITNITINGKCKKCIEKDLV